MPGDINDGLDGAGWTGTDSLRLDKPENQYGVAAMGFSILGGLLKGMASIQAAGANAGVDRANADLALSLAGDARLRGHIAAQHLLLRGAQLASKQKAAFAGSGVDVKSGSAVDVQADTQGMSAFDALMAENNAAREAWGYEQKSRQLKQRAVIDEASGMNQAGESILGGISGAGGYFTKRHLMIS